MKKLFWLLVLVLIAWWAWSYYSPTPVAPTPTADSVESVGDVDATLNSLDTADIDKELDAVDAEMGNL